MCILHLISRGKLCLLAKKTDAWRRNSIDITGWKQHVRLTKTNKTINCALQSIYGSLPISQSDFNVQTARCIAPLPPNSKPNLHGLLLQPEQPTNSSRSDTLLGSQPLLLRSRQPAPSAMRQRGEKREWELRERSIKEET